MEIWYSDMDSCLEDYRKESSVKWKIRTLSQILRSTPTYRRCELPSLLMITGRKDV
jgi:hypothetical protein